jgi:hypothetical protein
MNDMFSVYRLSSSFPRKRESMAGTACGFDIDPRFRGGDEFMDLKMITSFQVSP